jgi:hypothetical protein
LDAVQTDVDRKHAAVSGSRPAAAERWQEEEMAYDASHGRGKDQLAELSEAEQRQAMEQFAAGYKREIRPPLTPTERREREGNVTLPVTQQMRREYAEGSRGLRLFITIGMALAAFLVIVIVMSLLSLPLPAALLLAVVGAAAAYRGTARWWRTGMGKAASAMATYDRYAGACTIEERYSVSLRPNVTKYGYTVTMASPPARVSKLTFAYRNWDQHKEVCAITWGTIEYDGTRVISVRDGSDHLVYHSD